MGAMRCERPVSERTRNQENVSSHLVSSKMPPLGHGLMREDLETTLTVGGGILQLSEHEVGIDVRGEAKTGGRPSYKSRESFNDEPWEERNSAASPSLRSIPLKPSSPRMSSRKTRRSLWVSGATLDQCSSTNTLPVQLGSSPVMP